MSSYPVGQVARLAGVTVRALHHYDEIGLLSPTARDANGYRRYGDADLQRLHRIRLYRELGFPLDEIAEILADPAADPGMHLRRQHRLLRERIERLRAVLTVLEKEMEAHAMGISLTPQEQFEIFGTDRLDEWADEAEQRWGDTDPYRQSARRTAAYGKDDWIAIKAEADRTIADLAAAMRDGEPATGERAMAAAEAHRQHIGRWFYDCGYELHRGLAEMYVADPRFTKVYDDVAPGLARYVHDAIVANADRAIS